MNLTTETQVKSRLIVLIPDQLASHTGLARQIHHMADQENLAVLYLVRVDDGDEKLDAMRHMATMKAVTSASRLDVDTMLIKAEDCREIIQKIASPGDRVAVLDKQAAAGGYIKMTPVSEFLADRLPTGIPPARPARMPPWINQIISLAGFLILIAVFTWLEINLDLAFNGTVQKILLILLFGAELGSIVVWNQFTSG